jgi:hypothetical protein
MRYKIPQRGFIALTTMLVISAVALAVSISISLIGVSRAKNSLDYIKGQKTLKIAEGCAEVALLELRDDVNYLGGSPTMGDGMCTISISGAGSDRTIDVEATISEASVYVRRLQLTIKRTGNSVNIVSWNQIE